MLGLEAREVTIFMMGEMHPLSPAMKGKACKKDSFTLKSDMEPLQAKLCSNNVRTIALRLASFTTHLSMRSRLSLATVGDVEQRNREESIGRILATWVWDTLVMGWSQGGEGGDEVDDLDNLHRRVDMIIKGRFHLLNILGFCRPVQLVEKSDKISLLQSPLSTQQRDE